jgi:ketosteroid isomerase-like protein
MSQENVEVVRRAVSALARADWQAVFETWDPQIEWHFEREAVISGVRRGRDEVRAALSSFMTEWEDLPSGSRIWSQPMTNRSWRSRI